MSAQALAEVWRELLDHRDNENLIREIFGNYDIYQSPTSLADAYQPSRQLFLRLRIFFDIQRTYLQCRPGQPRNPTTASYLIPLDLHYAIIQRILHLGTTTQFQHGTDPEENSCHQLLIVQTLFSAFRAFLLQHELTSTQINETRLRLENLVQTWENRSYQKLPQTEDFILSFVLPQTLEFIKHPISSAIVKRFACGSFDLAEYPSLHPFKISYALNRSEPMSSALQNIIRELDGKNWITAYWTLCDVTWAVKAATIKLHVDQPRQQLGSGSDLVMNKVLSLVFEKAGIAQLGRRPLAIKSLSDAMLSSYGAATISEQDLDENFVGFDQFLFLECTY
jgi:hypothetical protein